jgi:tight adherence protein C
VSLLAAGAGAAVAGVGTLVILGRSRARVQAEDWAARRASGKPELCADLAALGQVPQDWAAFLVRRVSEGLVVGAVLGGVGWVLVGPIAVVAVVLGPIGALLGARVSMRARAVKARDGLERAAVELAELVSLGAAAGLGLAGALAQGGFSVDGPAGRRLTALIAGSKAPWCDIEDLGQAARVGMLSDLGHVLRLASERQSPVRELLLDWALASREVLLDRDEAAASNRSEVMTASLVLVAMGYVVLIALPAVAALLNAHPGSL